MALTLTIVKSPMGVTLHEHEKTFGPDGGSIGRGADNDWVLPDPDRFLSSKHCKVTQEGNTFCITDMSTNGTFVNGSSEPLGRGGKLELSEGDSFDLGDYRLKVSLGAELGGFSVAPQGFDSNMDFIGDEFGAPGAAPESMYMSSDYGDSVGDITPDELKVTDPLEALDKAGGYDNPLGANPAPPRDQIRDTYGESDSGHDPLYGGSQEDSADFLNNSADWPEAKPDNPMLPDDWDDDISVVGFNQPKQPSVSRNLPNDDSLIVQKPSWPEEETPPPPRPGSGRTPRPPRPSAPPPPQAETRPPENYAYEEPPAPPPKPRPQRQRPAGGGSVDRTLIDALGFTDVDLSDEQIRDIHETVGLMVRETIDGLMQVLRSRSSIKKEFRMNMTTIQPIENNPIKFSVNADEVLEIMFLRQSRAYKKPVEAVQESFYTIADHQMAVIAGIRSAFRSAMKRFDPLVLEDEFSQGKGGGLLSGLSKGKYWSAYQHYYQEVVNNMERSFQEMFGDEFVQAYEDQLLKLSNARKQEL